MILVHCCNSDTSSEHWDPIKIRKTPVKNKGSYSAEFGDKEKNFYTFSESENPNSFLMRELLKMDCEC